MTQQNDAVLKLIADARGRTVSGQYCGSSILFLGGVTFGCRDGAYLHFTRNGKRTSRAKVQAEIAQLLNKP